MKQLRDLARSQDLTVSDIIREALRDKIIDIGEMLEDSAR
jgi:hypothetical protein